MASPGHNELSYCSLYESTPVWVSQHQFNFSRKSCFFLFRLFTCFGFLRSFTDFFSHVLRHQFKAWYSSVDDIKQCRVKAPHFNLWAEKPMCILWPPYRLVIHDVKKGPYHAYEFRYNDVVASCCIKSSEACLFVKQLVEANNTK